VTIHAFLKRKCGDCTLCCKLFEVQALNKPQGVWCSHCDKGKGCKIYETRPEACQKFDCAWLAGVVPEDLKPNETHVVLTQTSDQRLIQVNVDPVYPDAYKHGIVKRFILNVIQPHLGSERLPADVVVVIGQERHLITADPENQRRYRESTGEECPKF